MGQNSSSDRTYLPDSLAQLIKQGSKTGNLKDIEHVILYMQENRSFDHYFGHLPGVIGYGDSTVLPRRGGTTVMRQPRGGSGDQAPSETDVEPYPVSKMAELHGQEVREQLSHLPHTYIDGQAAWAGGWWDGWIPAKGLATMGYYTSDDVPLQHEIANSFTICDQYFASMMAGTTPNRHYWMTGHSGYEPISDRPVSGARCVENDAFDAETQHEGYDWATQAEVLQEAGVTWQVYQEWDNYGDNNLEYFTTFKRIARQVLTHVSGGQFRVMRDFYLSFLERSQDEIVKLLAELEQGVDSLNPTDRALYDRGLRRCAPGELTSWIDQDMQSGIFPTVSYVVAPSHLCEHPETSSPEASASLTYQLLDVLGNNPHVFSKSVTVYTFDEFDGLFDHVPPPTPPRGTADEWVSHGDGSPVSPMGLGARVPALIISPWSIGGRVCSEVFDHTSNVQLVERVTGVPMPTISQWRRDITGDLTSAIGFCGVEQPTPDLPRPRCSLPYQLSADCDTSDFPNIKVTFSNTGRRPAPVALYGFAGETEYPIHEVVPAGETRTIDVQAQSDEYFLVATGPAAFRRDFTPNLATLDKDGSHAMQLPEDTDSSLAL